MVNARRASRELIDSARSGAGGRHLQWLASGVAHVLILAHYCCPVDQTLGRAHRLRWELVHEQLLGGRPLQRSFQPRPRPDVARCSGQLEEVT